MDSFIFAIIRKRAEKKIRKQYKDLETFTTTHKPTHLTNTFVILTDSIELETEILDDKSIKVINKYETLLDSIHITDQLELPFNKSKKTLRFRFILPSTIIDNEGLIQLTKMAIHYIDRIAEIRLSATTHTKNEMKRKKFVEQIQRASHKDRQEAAAKRKEELKRIEAEQLANLTPEQLKRKEEKEYKLALKKKSPRVKLIR